MANCWDNFYSLNVIYLYQVGNGELLIFIIYNKFLTSML